MQNVKERVLQAIQRLPDDAGYRDVSEEIALLAAVADAEEEIKKGNLVSSETMELRLESWLNG
ncbi:MAG: hypothetical protein NWT08_02715 [Akkermansiaceae bacterium]|jgi:hypothetical protein|nr:hypothetical protein [Akkermansiaceae bacterium]MDP4646316.1 hypothetical protein [Akkermansiaceae bacterium]MDP4721449.1 hypothetical protein [Akkermansiaceae bacterium]MDP4779843.1 hypothetical protein [Akkermansiaceae bacterium]MDP4845810.1 hypothetical protein [Akkermansiaceae bacterium]